MTPVSKPTLAEIGCRRPAFSELLGNTVRWLDGEHGLFLFTMAMIAGVLLALNGGVMR